jgi:hypothetical protein
MTISIAILSIMTIIIVIFSISTLSMTLSISTLNNIPHDSS